MLTKYFFQGIADLKAISIKNFVELYFLTVLCYKSCDKFKTWIQRLIINIQPEKEIWSRIFTSIWVYSYILHIDNAWGCTLWYKKWTTIKIYFTFSASIGNDNNWVPSIKYLLIGLPKLWQNYTSDFCFLLVDECQLCFQ